jgi:restriction system protein
MGGAEEAAVPLIPVWVKAQGYLLLIPVAVVLLVIAYFGQTRGAACGWVLLVTGFCVASSLWWLGYVRRLDAAQGRWDQALYVRLQMAKVNVMTGRQFEEYCADLLRILGYRDVVRVGDTPGKKAVDVIAIAPDGTPAAIECKRWKTSVGPKTIYELAGAISSGRYRGRAGILMTCARATPDAKAVARQNGIKVVDQPLLQEWMHQAKSMIEERHPAPAEQQQSPDDPAAGVAAQRAPMSLATSRLGSVRMASKVTMAVLCCSAIAVGIVAVQPATRKTTSAAPSAAQAGVPSPGSVAREFYVAINRRDWQEVWQLGGKNLGSGPYASYSGMISGYQLTERDVLTAVRTSGDSVTGRFFAYESTGTVQTYSFSYIVRGGTIVAGHQVLLETSHS